MVRKLYSVRSVDARWLAGEARRRKTSAAAIVRELIAAAAEKARAPVREARERRRELYWATSWMCQDCRAKFLALPRRGPAACTLCAACAELAERQAAFNHAQAGGVPLPPEKTNGSRWMRGA